MFWYIIIFSGLGPCCFRFMSKGGFGFLFRRCLSQFDCLLFLPILGLKLLSLSLSALVFLLLSGFPLSLLCLIFDCGLFFNDVVES